MRRILTILFIFTLIFSSCKKEVVLPCLCETNRISSIEYLNNDSSEIINVFIPNSFTPNGDSRNDNFFIWISHVRDSVNYANSGQTIQVQENISYNLFIEGDQVVFDSPSGYNVNNSHWNGQGYSDGEYCYLITFNFNGINYQKNGKVYLINDLSNLSNNFDCYPEGISNCSFGDQIDPWFGFIYPTSEDIINI